MGKIHQSFSSSAVVIFRPRTSVRGVVFEDLYWQQFTCNFVLLLNTVIVILFGNGFSCS